ncbi:carbohydrate-binding module family 13 protein [Vararia minispora EC-137]|uniref:Carbohydrate-binding module family 13 protein n=1 Tax=Vararia minispora EC-137 TaxID=1314806 RepID=A0ACB8QBN5_9AGAM|nr:carbohydrate-binding module family 13 protein [Vararia minispora EC-137]
MSVQSVENGQIYTIVNVKGGTACDLSGGDNTSVIGYDLQGGDNQKWIFEERNGGYAIRNKRAGKYLGVSGNHVNGTSVIAVETDSPQIWEVHPDNNGSVRYVIFCQGQEFNLDLSDHGNPTPGTPISIWGKWDGENQLWKITPA